MMNHINDLDQKMHNYTKKVKLYYHHSQEKLSK